MFKSMKVKTNLVNDVARSGIIHTQAQDVSSFKLVAFQFLWTGSGIGSIDLEVSIDGVNWTLAKSGAPGPSGAPGDHVIEILTACKWVRGVYSHVSGSGTLSVNFSGTRG